MFPDVAYFCNSLSALLREQLTLPVDILEKKYGASTGIVHAAYTDWLLMKLKHICFRAYLAEENTDPFNKKVSEFSKVLHTAPWIEVLNRRNTQQFKKRSFFCMIRILRYTFTLA